MGEKDAISIEEDNSVGGSVGQGSELADAAPNRGIAEAMCPACGGVAPDVAITNPVDYEYGVESARAFCILACQACETQWLYPRPEVEELVSFYPPDYHAYHDDHGLIASMLVAVRAWLRARQYRRLLPAEGGALFDVGAGDCRHFRELSGTGQHRFAGVEIHPQMAERARAAGFDVETGVLEEMDIERHLGCYHAVSMNHVLEHVLDPREVVERTFQMLRPGGRLIGQLPNISSWEPRAFGGCWAGYHFPRHTQIFSRSGLTRLLQSCGFEDVQIRSAPHVQTALSIQNWIVQQRGRGGISMGRAPYFGLLLLVSLPVEAIAFVLNQSGVVDFEAVRPGAP
jgi:SAM-dependent methyltransferase